MPIQIDESKCPKNHTCPASASCPVKALSQKNEQSAPVADHQTCIECRMCISVCPNAAIYWED